jgi:hypothetical protein
LGPSGGFNKVAASWRGEADPKKFFGRGKIGAVNLTLGGEERRERVTFSALRRTRKSEVKR